MREHNELRNRDGKEKARKGEMVGRRLKEKIQGKKREWKFLRKIFILKKKKERNATTLKNEKDEISSLVIKKCLIKIGNLISQ